MKLIYRIALRLSLVLLPLLALWAVLFYAAMVDEINDEAEGYYVLYTFNSAPSFPHEFERRLRIADGVLRSLVVARV